MSAKMPAEMAEAMNPPAREGPGARFALALGPELTRAAIRRRVEHVNVLLRASLLGALQLDLDVALNVLVDQAGDVAPFDQALLYLWDEDRERLSLEASRGVDAEAAERLAQGTRLTEWTIGLGRPLLLPSADDAEASPVLGPFAAASATSVPLFVSGRPRGVLEVYRRRRERPFTIEDVRFLVVLALQAEAILHRHQDRALLAKLATTDPLTGLYNRRYFDETLARELTRALRARRPLSLLMADVDHFKAYNDRFTHVAGDQALRDVARLLEQAARRGDIACRFGGEEFAVILPDTDEVGALTFARRVAEAMERHRFPGAAGARDVRLTISIGSATAPGDARDHGGLVHVADLALYRAKALGRNRVVQAAEVADGGLPATSTIDYDLVVRAVNSFATVGQLLDLLTRMVMETVGGGRASLMVLDRARGELAVKSAQGQRLPAAALATMPVRLGEGVAGVVAALRRPFATADITALAGEIPGLRPNGSADYTSRSALALPLVAAGQVIGTIHVSNPRPGTAFGAEALDLALPLAAQIAGFLSEGIGLEQSQQRFIELAASAVAVMVDARSGAHGHGRRVADLATAIARDLLVPEPQVARLAVAARLHDIGRLAITGDLFRKAAPLTEAEARLARAHPTLGAKILETVPGLEAERAMVLMHHERLDGSGYPQGLAGAEIPLATRILSVADVYDAMTSDRPHRPALSREAALAELRRRAGAHFDARVVAALKRVVTRRPGTSAA